MSLTDAPESIEDDPDYVPEGITGPPILPATTCPVEHQPSGVRSAVTKAAKFGWSTRVTLAIAFDGTWSVVFCANRNGLRLVTRHEGTEDKLGFKQGYRVAWGKGLLPIGWREMLTALESPTGEPARPVLAPKEAKGLSDARETVQSLLEGSRAVALVDSLPLCKSIVEPGRRCNRQAAPNAPICAGPCSTTPDWS